MDFLEHYINELGRAVASIDRGSVAMAVEWIQEARDQGRMIFVAGNGGSAATAANFVCDMVKGASYGHQQRFRIMSLAEVPTLTAYSNDVSYDAVFVEPLKNFAGPSDLFIAISGSGNSPNVVKATEYANSAGCKTIALTGRDGGKLAQLAQLNLHVTSPHMGRIEDVHMVLCHMISYYFMEKMPGLTVADKPPGSTSSAPL